MPSLTLRVSVVSDRGQYMKGSPQMADPTKTGPTCPGVPGPLMSFWCQRTFLSQKSAGSVHSRQ